MTHFTYSYTQEALPKNYSRRCNVIQQICILTKYILISFVAVCTRFCKIGPYLQVYNYRVLYFWHQWQPTAGRNFFSIFGPFQLFCRTAMTSPSTKNTDRRLIKVVVGFHSQENSSIFFLSESLSSEISLHWKVVSEIQVHASSYFWFLSDSFTVLRWSFLYQ